MKVKTEYPHGVCEVCERRKVASKKAYQKNKERRKDSVRKWRKKNPEKARELNRRSYINCRDKILAKKKVRDAKKRKETK